MSTVSDARQLSAEVLYADPSTVCVAAEDLAALKQLAEGNLDGRIRLCMHPSIDHALHEMLIVHRHGTYVRPHKHLDKAESLHVIEGLVERRHTVVAVEHHLDVIRRADHIIDLGPEGGAGGGRVVAAGTPEDVIACKTW